MKSKILLLASLILGCSTAGFAKAPADNDDTCIVPKNYTTLDTIYDFASGCRYVKWLNNTCSCVGKIPNTTLPDTLHIPSTVTDENGVVFTVKDIQGHQSSRESGAFHDETTLKFVTFPSTVKTIYGYAFAGCKNLKNISLPDSLERLGIGAFMQCGGFDELTIPGTLKDYSGNEQIVANRAFYETPIKKLTIKEGIYRIGTRAFSTCGLTELTIPSSVYIINYYAFEKNDFTEVTVPSTVGYVHEGAFAECPNLQTVNWNTSTPYINSASIRPWMFYNCTSLKTVNFGDDVVLKHICNNAFDGCVALEDLDLPVTLKKIGEKAFHNCTSLMAQPTPNSVDSIAPGAFSGTTMLHYTLPSWIRIYEANLLDSNFNVTEVTIPAYVERMNTFGNNTHIKNIYVMGDTLFDGLKAQRNLDGTKINIYIKKDVYDQGIYQNDTSWTNHFNIEYEIPLTFKNTQYYVTQGRDFDTDYTNSDCKVYYGANVNDAVTVLGLDQLAYVPSRLRANEEGYTGVDEYVGVIVEGEPGKTIYYRIGQFDYTLGKEGQYLLSDAREYTNSLFNGSISNDIDNITGEDTEDVRNLLVDNHDQRIVASTVTDKEDNTYNVYALYQNKMRRMTGKGRVPYNTACLLLDVNVYGDDDDEAKALSFEFNRADGTTKIVSAEEFAAKSADDVIYNAMGQIVNDNYKGIVIKNGKKYINK